MGKMEVLVVVLVIQDHLLQEAQETLRVFLHHKAIMAEMANYQALLMLEGVAVEEQELLEVMRPQVSVVQVAMVLLQQLLEHQ
jgi:hypothetical protein